MTTEKTNTSQTVSRAADEMYGVIRLLQLPAADHEHFKACHSQLIELIEENERLKVEIEVLKSKT